MFRWLRRKLGIVSLENNIQAVDSGLVQMSVRLAKRSLSYSDRLDEYFKQIEIIKHQLSDLDERLDYVHEDISEDLAIIIQGISDLLITRAKSKIIKKIPKEGKIPRKTVKKQEVSSSKKN